MVNIFWSEMLKLKRSKMLWLVVIGALLPAVLVYIVGLNKQETGILLKWETMVNNNLMLMTMLMAPALFSLFAGYLVGREYQERTVNSFLTVPRSRILLLFGKYLAMVPIILATSALALLFTVGSGLLLKTEALTGAILWNMAQDYFGLFVVQFALISFPITVSIIGKSYVPAMGFGIFAVTSEFIIMQSKYIMYYPWSAPLNLLVNMAPEHNNSAIGVTVLALAFFIPLFFNILYFSKADVHSG